MYRGVEQVRDVGWELVVWSISMKSDSICGVVGSFGHGEDEVRDSSSTRSVEAEATVGNTTLCDVEGMGRDWGTEMKELCDEGGLEVICCINEGPLPAFPVLTLGSRGEGGAGRQKVGYLVDGTLGEETEASSKVGHGVGKGLCVDEGSSHSF